MINDSVWVGQHFQAKEFRCPCCGLNEVHPKIVTILDRIRKDIGTPLRISSGVRCPTHNRSVGGASQSYHLPQDDGKGYAADFTFARGMMKIPINIARLYTMASDSADVGGAILYPTWVHIDVRGEMGKSRYRSTGKFPWPRIKS